MHRVSPAIGGMGFRSIMGLRPIRRSSKPAGLGQTTGVIITTGARDVIDAVVSTARKKRPEMLIVSRARDADHARHLYEMGATDVVPETIEASLQLSEAALVGLGVAAGPAIASIHEKRDEFRHALQQAVRDAGHEARPKLRRKIL